MQPTVDELLAQLTDRTAPERILENPFIAGKKLSPLEGKRGYYVIALQRHATTSDGAAGLPVPPKELWEGYGKTAAEYLALGQEHMSNMLRALQRAGAAPESFQRVLDFGCAAARMLRFFPNKLVKKAELWGVDLKADSISWCQQNLGPPFLFSTNTTSPHLPFEDNYFDLVYAGSVFTHIADLPDAWFLELRRILRKGGYAYVTITDKKALEILFAKYLDRKDLQLGWFVDLLRRFDSETKVLSEDYGCFSIEGGRWGGFPVPQVFYDLDYLKRKWSPLATLVSVNHEAYGFQTALLFQK
jgi:ubiquinone/menaquinone biosynthesis C-methylase UbiE